MKQQYLTITYWSHFPNAASVKTENLLRATSGNEDFQHPERFYYPEGGPTHFYLRKGEYEIVEDHGQLDPRDDDDWEIIKKLIIDNFHRFHQPETELRVGAGWMSPEGIFYPCESWAHDSKADVICRAVLGNLKGTRHLEEVGWLRIYDDGMVARTTDELTQKQTDAIWDLHQKSSGEFQRRVGLSIGIHEPTTVLKKPQGRENRG